MNYVQLKKSDYDKSIKLNDQLCLYYSAKKFKDIEPDDVKILGEVKKGSSKKEPIAKLSVESKLVDVYEEGTFSKLLYKKSGYIAVEKSDGYITVLESRLPLILWILGLLIIAIIVVILSLHSPGKESVDPYNPLPPVDTNAEVIADDTTQESTVPEGGGKVGIGYDKIAYLSLATNEISMEYKNPSVSSHDAIIELCIISNDKVYPIAESGRIPSGSKLNKMVLSDNAPTLSEGMYNAMFNVYYYDSKTGEKAMVSSEIEDINLIVNSK